MDSGGSLYIYIYIKNDISVGIEIYDSLRECQKQSQTSAMGSGGSQNIKNGIILIGIKIPDSLRECQKQSEVGAIDSGGSLELKNSLNC